MQHRFVVCLMAAFFVFAPGAFVSAAATTTVFSEDFSSTATSTVPDGWTQSPENTWGVWELTDGATTAKFLMSDDVEGEPYRSNINSTTTSPTINLDGMESAQMSFTTYCDTEYTAPGTDDYVVLEMSADGVNFATWFPWNEKDIDDALGDTSSSSGAEIGWTTDITPYFLTSNFKFQFRWVTDGDTDTGSSGFGCMVDNIVITAHEKETPAPVVTAASLADLAVDGTTVAGFASTTLTYDVVLPVGTTLIPTVTATTTDASSSVVVTQTSALPGSATAVVSGEGLATTTYTINFTVTAPEESSPTPVTSSSGGNRRNGGHSHIGETTIPPRVIATSTATTTGAVLGVATFKFTTDLRFGMRSDDVMELQKRLRSEGFFTFPTDTGYFGPVTQTAVMDYQEAHPEIGYITGFCGPLTRAVLNK